MHCTTRDQPRSKAALPVPAELDLALQHDNALQSAFEKFPPCKQQEFIAYVGEARQATTRAENCTHD